MATITLTDGRVYYAGIDLSGQSNKIMLGLEAAELDASSVKDTWDVNVMGRKKAMVDVSGFWAAGTGYPDDLFAKLGTANQVVTIGATGVDGDTAYSVQGVLGKYTIGGGTGEVLPFSMNAKGDSGIRAMRGTYMHADATARTATGTGTIRQLGAVGSTSRVYAALHVLSASGTTPTLDVTVESAALVGFGSPTTRLTFSQFTTAAGGQWQSAAGAITDQFWRVKYTISGTTPSYLFAVVVGIH